MIIDIGLNLTSSQFAGEQADLVERARAAGWKPDPDRHRSGWQPRVPHWPPAGPVTASPPPGYIPMMPKRRWGDPARPARTGGPCPRWWPSASAVSTTTGTSPRPVQDAVFDAQLALAAELGMPVFLHCRDAHDKFVEILRPGCPRLPGPCCTASPAPTPSWTSAWRWGCISG